MEKNKRIGVRLDVETIARLEALAGAKQITTSEAIRHLVHQNYKSISGSMESIEVRQQKQEIAFTQIIELLSNISKNGAKETDTGKIVSAILQLNENIKKGATK